MYEQEHLYVRKSEYVLKLFFFIIIVFFSSLKLFLFYFSSAQIITGTMSKILSTVL